MISYDNYKNRIEKLAKFRRILHKFRFLICGVLALIVGASVGLMVAKGSYTSGMSLSAQTVMFNEEYEVTAAKAFLASSSEQYIEYRAEEGDWTKEKPVKAGKYSARTVTKKLVGYNYSPAVSFEIKPLAAEFTITADSVVYGEVPKYALPQLISGHSVDESVLQFEYAEYGALSTEVKVIADTLKIIDKNGEDFTDCYEFAEHQGKELTIGKRKITVTPVSYEFAYDAQPHYTGGGVSDDTEERLVAGDTLAVTTAVSAFGTAVDGAVNAGRYTVNIESVSISHDGKDISNWYDIGNRTSLLMITPRALIINTGDAQKVYDGTPAVNTEFTSDNLIDGHSVTVNMSTLPYNPDVGEYKNEFGVIIFDGSTDVTGNYKVSCNAGTLTITPATLAVTTSTPDAHTYDGNNFTDFAFVVADRENYGSDFEFMAVESLATATADAGEYENKFDIKVFLDGRNVTGNFDISYVYGKLTVLKRDLIITTVGATKVYNGEALTYADCYGDNLAENQTLKEVTPFTVTNVTTGDGVTIAAKFTVVDQAQNDVGKNYEINYVNGKLIIEPLKISVKTVDASREYDGTAFTDTGYVATRINAEGTGLCGDDALFPKGFSSRTEAGSQPNVCGYDLPTYDGTHSNYEIVGEITYGTLTVEPKKVTVTINDATAVYGEAIPDNGFTLSCGELPNNETLTFTAHFERGGEIRTPETWEDVYTLLDAGNYLIVQNDDKQVTGGNASTDNYEFAFVAGTLEIAKRRITVTTATASHIYDGNEFSDTSYTTAYADGNGKGLLNGDELTVVNHMTVKTIYDIPTLNVVTYDVPNGNYVIAQPVNYGTLTIKPRPIVVYTGSDTKPYDGTPLTAEGYTVKYAVEVDGEWVADESEVGLIAGDELTLKGSPASITNAGETANANRYENGNYSIKKYVDGTLKIEKYKVEFSLSYMYSQYGKQNVLEQFGMTYADALVNGELLEVIHKFKQNGEFVKLKDVGIYVSVAASYNVYNASGKLLENGADNYEIKCNDGNYEILPRPVTVDINDGTAVYGDDVSAKQYGFVTDPAELPYNEILTLTYKYDREVRSVGKYDILEDKFYIDGAEEGVNNYAFTFNSGTLTVTQMLIKPHIVNKSCVYGEDLPEIEYWFEDTDGVRITEFPYGDTVELDVFYYYQSETHEFCGWHSDTPRLNADKYIIQFNYLRENGNIEHNSNYVLAGYNFGDYTLTVTPAPLKITLADITGVAYGDEFTYPYKQTTFEGLKYNQTLSFEVKYADEDGNFGTPKNAGDYDILPDEDSYAITNEDKTAGLVSNYTVTYESGTLTIGKKQVHIKLIDKARTYGFVNVIAHDNDIERVDGLEEPILAYDEVLWIVLGYKDGDKELIKTDGDWRLSVGDYSMYAAEFLVGTYISDNVLGDIEGGLDNYDISCDEGTLTVEKYAVTVKPNDRTCVYGTPEDEIEDKGFEYTDSQTVLRGGLPYGENLILSYAYEPSPVTDVGTYAIKATATGVVGGDLKNYTVSYEDGELTVEALEIYVVLNDTNKTEYGTAPKETGHRIYLDAEKTKSYTLLGGDEFKADYEYYKYDDADKTTVPVKNVGYYGIRAVNARIETSDGDPSGNYTVHVIDGKLTVNVKNVEIQLYRVTDVNYGETFDYPSGLHNYRAPDNPYTSTELAYGEQMEITAYYRRIEGSTYAKTSEVHPTKAGSYEMTWNQDSDHAKIYESDGVTEIADGLDNYHFSYTINIAPIYIKPLLIWVSPLEYSQAKGNALQYGDLPSFSYPDYIGNHSGDILGSDRSIITLPYNEQLKVTRISFKHKDESTYKSTLEDGVGLHQISVYSFEIYDKDGNLIEEGDGNYSIVRKASIFEIVPRKITVQLNSYQMAYGEFYIENEGGTFQYPEIKNNYDLDNSDPLVYGQMLEIGFSHGAKYQLVEGGEFVTPKEVGTYIITFEKDDYVIYDGYETYYEGSYDIEFLTGTLTIDKKILNVNPENKECTYGDDIPANTLRIADVNYKDCVLPYGDEFEALTYYYWYLQQDGNYVKATPRNAGTYKILLDKFGITNDGDDVSGNYTVWESVGTLIINKADLKLSLANVRNAVYGDRRSYPSGVGNFDAEKTVGIKNNDNFELVVEYEVDTDYANTGLVTVGDKSRDIPTNAAYYYINLVASESVIHTTEGEQFDLELNYNVECKHEFFIIGTRGVYAVLSVPAYTYGETVEKPEFTINVITYAVDESEISTTELPYNEGTPDFDFVYEDEDGNIYDTPVNAGTYKIKIAKKYVKGREDLAGNYHFGLSSDGDQTLTINKKVVDVELSDFSQSYGATVSYEFDVNAPLAYGESAKFVVRYLQDGVEVTPENKGVYDIEIIEYIVYDEDGVEITNGADNYDFRPDCGQMTITALEVIVTVDDQTATYGDDLTELLNDFTVNIEMPYGEKFELSYTCELGTPNVGDYENAITATVDGVTGGNASLDNYDIKEVIFGKLTVVAREITVTVTGGTTVYGYTQLPEIAHEVTVGELVGEENLVPAYKFSLNGEECEPIIVGAYDIEVDEDNCTVTGGNALYGNYSVTYVYEGQLVIDPAPLTVKIIGDSYVYGDRTPNVTFDITDGELFHGDNLELTYAYINKENGDKTAAPTAAGKYAITATAAIFGGNESIDNYDVSYEDDPEPTLTIEKRGIEITLNKGNVNAFAYGTDYAGEICNAEIINAVNGQTITVAVTYAKKEDSGAGAARSSRARTFTAREAETFIPKDAGTYIAKLDFENCTVEGADGNPVYGGIDNYALSTDCGEVEFVISPMALTVTVKNAEITYGDKLPAALEYGEAEKMPYGESLVLTFSFADENGKLPTHKGTYPVRITGVSIDGGSIENYKPEYVNEQPTLTINAKDVTLTLNNLSVSYGAEVKYEVKAGNYKSANGLLSGDVLTVTEVYYKGADGKVYDAENPPANVGTYAIVYGGCTIVNADGEDAYGDYVVDGKDGDGELIIDSSLITVYTASAEKEYDGTALFTEDYDDYDGDLGEYRLVVDKENICKQTDATDSEGVDNTTEFKIVDKNNKETDNLKLQYGTPGKLIVTRKSAQITISDTTAVYGEKPVIGHTAVGLVDGEDVEFEVTYDVEPTIEGGRFILPVGGYLMNYKEGTATIVGGQGRVDNYVLSFDYDAFLEVTPRHIAVTTASGSAEYSGSPFSKPEGYTTEWVVDGVRQGATGLLGEDELTAVDVASQTEFGSCVNACTYTVPNNNYVIVETMYAYGTLNVTKRTVRVKTADVNEIYDGEAHSDGKVTDIDGKLAEGHEFRVTSALVSRVDVCSNVENALTVIIVDTNDGDKNVTANYALSYSYGKISITARPLEITTGGVTVAEYDGKPHGNTDYENADGLLKELTHKLVVDTEFTYTDATEGEDNETTYKVYCGGVDVSGNYEISYICGKIVIGKKTVTVTLNGGVQVEYGDSNYDEKITENAVTLVNGETAEIAITTDREVGSKGKYMASVDWTNTVVKNAGGKIIRNGADNYSPVVTSSVEFEVIPRTVTVTLNKGGKTEFEYGENFDGAIRTASVSRTVYGEEIIVAVTYGDTDPKDVGEYTAELDAANCTVEGGDIENYNIVSGGDVNFKIVAKKLTVYMNDLTVAFNEPLVYPEGNAGYYRVEGLLDGETVTAVVPAFEKDGVRVTPSYAGEYDIVCGRITVNDGAVDRKNYSVQTGKPYGKLTIEGVSVSIERHTVEKIYDGDPLELSAVAGADEISYVIDGAEGEALPAGYEIVLAEPFATKDGNVSSSRANEATYKVVDESGNIARNYVITYVANDAKLVIKPRPVHITTKGATRAYNGAPLTAGYEYASDELVGGHLLKTSNPAQITDVGSTPNTVTVKITANGADVTANYEIITTNGTLTVEALPVTVQIADMTKVYGEDLGVNKFLQKTLINSEKLLYKVQIYTVDGELCDTTAALDAGSYVIKGNDGNMSVSGGKLSNYEISFASATLTIGKREIIVTTATDSAEYSGLPFSKPDGYTTEWIKDGVMQVGSGLLSGDTLTLIGTPASQTDVGSCRNVCEYTVSDNYEIASYVYGTLTVTQKSITVTTGGISEEYSGTAYVNGNFSYDIALPEGYTISAGELMRFIDATQNAENEFEVIIKDGENVDVSANYDIHYVYGKVIITPADLYVTLGETEDGGNNFYYGDRTFDGIFKNVTVEGLLADDKLTTVVLKYSTGSGSAPVNAGDYTVWLDDENSVISYAGTGNGIGNYNVICDTVAFTISRRSVTFTLDGWDSEEYDGEEHVYDTDGCNLETELFGSERLANVAVKYLDGDGNVVAAPKNAGTYYVVIDTENTTVTVDDGETAIGTNYTVNCEPLEFVITRKTLVITFSNVTHTYDGTEFDFAASEGFKTNLCDGDEIKRSYKYDAESVIDVDTYTVTFDGNAIEFTSGLASNYEFDNASLANLEAKLTVQPREITVTVADRDVEKGFAEYTVADISADFVEGDLAKAEVGFIYTDKDGNTSVDAPENTGTYTVAVTLGGKVMSNYTVEKVEGTLTVTERKVKVTPVFVGDDDAYNGKAMSFGYSHSHNVAGAEDDYGFLDGIENGFTASFRYTDANGVTLEGTPVNAGTYTVEITLSGDGIDQYFITYEPINFTVKKRSLSYSVEVVGTKSFVYNKLRPEFETTLTANGFAEGDGDDCVCVLYAGNSVATRYDVGTYEVRISFAGMANYDITATTDEIRITPRTIVVTPVDRYNGVPQEYDGTNLKLRGDRDFVISSSVLENGGLATGDTLTIESTEIAPTVISGDLKIVKVYIIDADGDVSGNYTVISSYVRTNKTVQELGLQLGDFQKRASYKVKTISYNLNNVGTEFPYTGATREYQFGGEGALVISDAVRAELEAFGHTLTVSKNSVTVPAAAGTYATLITSLVYVKDASGNRLAIYSPDCGNSEANAIKVTENKVSVDLSGVSVGDLEVGELNRAVTFLGENPATCGYEVRAFNLDGEWLIGVMLFNETSGRRTDMSANYVLDESCTLEGAEVRIITLTEAAKYELPEIKVEITVGAGDLSYSFDGESRWVLNGGYTVTGGDLLAANGHKLQVLVFKENGNYLLGVTIYSEDGSGRRTEAGGNYRVIVKSEVAARYVEMAEISTLQREIHLDFTNAYNAENGTLNPELVTVEGLNNTDGHQIEMTLEGNTVKVTIYQLRRMGSSYIRVNMTERYELHYVLPDGITDAVAA